jgi:hypothetical protein
MRKYWILIGAGGLNLLHGLLHIFQFIQSIFLIGHSHNETMEQLLHSPILSFIWAVVGLATLIIGIKDFKHHKNCK